MPVPNAQQVVRVAAHGGKLGTSVGELNITVGTLSPISKDSHNITGGVLINVNVWVDALFCDGEESFAAVHTNCAYTTAHLGATTENNFLLQSEHIQYLD